MMDRLGKADRVPATPLDWDDRRNSSLVKSLRSQAGSIPRVGVAEKQHG
jgi:hypothetical protein